MKLKGKRILITAGPTWVAIDSVRVISNIASGETGILLAEKLQQSGARVTLLLGPVSACCLNKKLKLVRYRFFQELKEKLIRELKTSKYDAVIHSAAVSDYQPLNLYPGKVKSDLKNWKLSLKPTEKIINLIKKADKKVLAVGFKFHPGAKKALLLREAQKLMQQARLDLVIANTQAGNKYQAYIISGFYGVSPLFSNKGSLALGLIKSIGDLI